MSEPRSDIIVTVAFVHSAEFNDDEIVNRIARRPVAEESPRRPFEPWHRPRKQWIRRYQWHDSLLEMMRETHFPADARIMRYLSLPGEDLLDVRVLREACVEAGVDMRFTGMVSVGPGSARDTRLNIAESEVRGLTRIRGTRALRQPSCWCQKQPCTRIAVR